ncbi:MAG: 3' terminal RNA ribose 2'-O-methyltransferase Hen1 [Stackebrandtia sp.]
MLVTISTTADPADDLGYLLHKHPDKVQRFAQSFGTATVFYPEADRRRCTAALLLEVDSVRLARSRKDTPDFALGQYVNDRPYAASSLLAVALGKVFGSARHGKCDARPEVAAASIPLEIELPAVPCRGGPRLAEELFAPLGWNVEAETVPLIPVEWGDSRYVRLRLSGKLKLSDALNHLYVLLPVLDDAKHYWVDIAEVDKLVRGGAGWLADHPRRALITRRYLAARRGLEKIALARLAEVDESDVVDVDPRVDEEAPEASEDQTTSVPLAEQRIAAVVDAIAGSGAGSVVDLGCGSGRLLAALLERPELTKVAGVDVSTRALRLAHKRLGVERMSERQARRLALFQGALTYTDARFAGYDAAVLMEVVEHVDPPRLAALERVVFGAARPGCVVVTTPNVEYNARYGMAEGSLRHPDHRFEWNRDEFAAWASRVAADHGYRVIVSGVGEADPDAGTPTQMGVFTRE